MIKRELYKVLPCRIGIEFELAGNFSEGFVKKYKVRKLEENILSKFYNLLEVKDDGFNRVIINKEAPIIEIRASLKDYHQLVGLYKFMQDLHEFCKIHENGGIHIHIDLPQELHNSDKLLQSYITNRLNEVEKMFPKYTGEYNKRKVGIVQKQTWVNISRLNTLEFRILPLTFEYNILIQWIKNIVTFRQILVNKLIKHQYNIIEKSIKQTLDTTILDNYFNPSSFYWERYTN